MTILSTASAVSEVIPEWNALAERDPRASPFGRGDVAVGLWRVLAPHLPPRVATYRGPDGRLLAVLPLALDRRRVGPLRLVILGPLPRWHGLVFDATVSPDAPDDAVSVMIEALREAEPRHDAIVVQRLGRDARIRRAAPCTVEGTTRRVRLTPAGATLRRSAAKNWRRTQRRTLECFPDLQVTHTHDDATLRHWLECFVAMHRARWAGTTTPSQFEAPGVGARFVECWAGLVRAGTADLHVMHAGPEMLAGLCTLRGRGTAYGWRIAVSTAHPTLGLGIQMCQAVMAFAGARGADWYELGIGEEAYKGLWEGEEQPLYRWRAPGPGPRWRMLTALGRWSQRDWARKFLAGRDPRADGTPSALETSGSPGYGHRTSAPDQAMIVRDVVYETTNGTTLLQGTVDAERVFWEFPATIAGEPRGEPFVAALLAAAMATGRPIELPDELPVDPTFMANVEQLQAIFARWFPGHQAVPIRATLAPHTARGDLRATGYSGGLDASYTVDVLAPRLDAVVLIEGIEYRQERPGLSDDVSVRLTDVMARRGLRMLRVRTNVKAFGRQLGAKWSVALGGALASAVHLLDLAEYHVAASNSWENLRPYGSHPLTDPLWSSAMTTIRHHGADLRRIEKARHLADVPNLLAELRVCFQGTEYNCGRCQKCLMTSAALRALQITTPALPQLADPTLLRAVYIEHEGDLVDWEEILVPDLARRDPALHAELTRAIRRFKWRTLLRSADALATGGRFRSLVRRRSPAA